MTDTRFPAEFKAFLATLRRRLKLRENRSEDITAELQSHLECRLADLIDEGVPLSEAISLALDELGDAEWLADEFRSVVLVQRRRRVMRIASVSVAAAVLIAAMLFSNGPAPDQQTRRHLQAQQPAAQSGLGKAAQDPNEATWKRLEAICDEASFKEATLEEFFQTLAAKNELQFFIDKRTFEEEGIAIDEPQVALHIRQVPLEMVLRLVLGQLDLDYSLDNGIIIISTADVIAQTENLQVRVYPVQDLVDSYAAESKIPGVGPGEVEANELPGGEGAHGGGEGDDQPVSGGGVGGLGGGSLGAGIEPSWPQRRRGVYDIFVLQDVIRESVDPDSWDDAEGNGTMIDYRGTLVVSQTWRTHRKIQQLLDELRANAASRGHFLGGK